MLELSAQQVAALAQLDARGYVEGVRQDLVKENPELANDATLPDRLWRAYVAARQLGVSTDENVAAFLRLEAFSPGFYEKPAARNWLTRPGRSADSRFHDYLRVIRWRVEHPEFKGGFEHGGFGGAPVGGRGAGAGANFGEIWRRFVGRSGGGRDG
ncbi:hypothetical protein [Paraburkholderia tropica]|uniref:hypothetical protein n=1 Tax=Paraburkholderia tropica TaxID=92647 RepID=UPI002AB1DA0E|nr:hypothetical protein [Paraburkholderia tropica]